MDKPFILSQRALDLINGALDKISEFECQAENLSFNVSPESDISSQPSIMTNYGKLDIRANPHVYKGLSYIIGKPGRKGFEWVSKPKGVNNNANA